MWFKDDLTFSNWFLWTNSNPGFFVSCLQNLASDSPSVKSQLASPSASSTSLLSTSSLPSKTFHSTSASIHFFCRFFRRSTSGLLIDQPDDDDDVLRNRLIRTQQVDWKHFFVFSEQNFFRALRFRATVPSLSPPDSPPPTFPHPHNFSILFREGAHLKRRWRRRWSFRCVRERVEVG